MEVFALCLEIDLPYQCVVLSNYFKFYSGFLRIFIFNENIIALNIQDDLLPEDILTKILGNRLILICNYC